MPAAVASTANSQASARTQEVLQTLMKQQRISSTRFSAAGDKAVFVVDAPISGKKLRSNLWLYELKSDRARQITYAGDRDTSPRWSPDDSRIAFLSKRGDGSPQVYVLELAGGEARAVTDAKEGVESFAWSAKGNEIAYLTTDPLPESPDKDKGDDEIDVRLAQQPTRLMVTGIDAPRPRRVIPGDEWSVSQFDWLPDGRLVLTATSDFVPERQITRLFVVTLPGGDMREIGSVDSVEYAGLQASPDGKFISYIGSSAGPTTHDLFVQPISGGPPRNLTGKGSTASVDRSVEDAIWTSASELTVSVQDGFGSAVHRIPLQGKATVLKRFAAEQIRAFDASRGRLLYAKTNHVAPQELWLLAGGAERKVTSLHGEMAGLLSPEIIRYAGAGGLEIEAALYRAPGRSTPGPLVLLLHGGPTGRFSHQITDWAQLLAASGISVLAPNVRGSVGYGEAFMMSNKGDWGGGDFQDVMAGVEHVIRLGVADPDRLGVAGWSYGGYLSASAITQTKRFKAAVVGAAMLDLNVQWGTELPVLIPYDSWYLGTPWDDPDNFRRMSPLSHVKSISTPTLLLVGERDVIDPPPQNYQFFRALRMRGVPSELIVYPREGHRITEEWHLRDVMTRMVGWFERYLMH